MTYAVAYHGLEDLKERLGLDSSLKWHSFSIGSSTKGNILGVRRSVVKGTGKVEQLMDIVEKRILG